MAKKETEKQQTVVISGEEHNVADLSQEQVVLLNHVADLESKIRQISISGLLAESIRRIATGDYVSSLFVD